MKTSAIALVLAVTAIACEEKQAPPNAKESTPATSASSVSSATAAKIDTKTAKELPATSANADAVKAFREGLDFSENSRSTDAIAAFKKALSLDPKFASAQGALGSFTPGAEGDKMLAAAIAAGASLPEAEKLVLQIYASRHASDYPKALESSKKLVELLPASWQAQAILGEAYNLLGKQDDAKTAFKKATELDPTAGPPHNALGYNALLRGDSDEAVAQLKKYAELRPKEPNPHDSYGEALLTSTKLDEAKVEFEKALELDPKFAMAQNGVGMVALYKGDYAKAYEAFGKVRDAKDIDFSDQAQAHYGIAWGQVAEKKLPDALKTLDALATAADKANDTNVKLGGYYTRAVVLLEGGKPADAPKVLSALGEAIDKTELPEPHKARWHTLQHTVEAVVWARQTKAAEADKARAAAEESAAKAEDADTKTWIAMAKSAALLAKGDAAGAATTLKDCRIFETGCLGERLRAEEKAGQKDAAAATRAALQKYRMREPESFFAWKTTAVAAK